MKASEEDRNRLRAQPVIDASLKRAMQKLTGIRQQSGSFLAQKTSLTIFFTEKNTEDKLIQLYLMLDHVGLLKDENLKDFEDSKACELKPIWSWNQLSDLDRLINILSLMIDNSLSQENTLLTQKNLTWVLEQSDLQVVEIIFKQLSDENKLDEAFIIFMQDKMTKTHAECIQYINKTKKLTASILEKVLE